MLICLYELGLYCTIHVALVSCLVIGHCVAVPLATWHFPGTCMCAVCALAYVHVEVEDGIGCLPRSLPKIYLMKTSTESGDYLFNLGCSVSPRNPLVNSAPALELWACIALLTEPTPEP